MRGHILLCGATLLGLASDVGANPPDEPAAAGVLDDAPEPRAQRTDYVIPAVEVVLGAIAASATLQLAGVSWAKIDTTTMRENLQGSWVWDSDPFATNQLLHPYGGSAAFLAARSSGLGFWRASLYAAGGSLLWEAVMENEPPSLNDQITTSIGGSFLGEALHRWTRVLLWNDGARPGILRQFAAAVLDWPAAVNSSVFGDAWSRAAPPRAVSAIRIGWSSIRVDHSDDLRFWDRPAQLHVGLVLRHGLPGDRELRLRRPFDHFELESSIDATGDELAARLHIRGMLYGASHRRGSVRGLWGLVSTFDFANPDRTRVGAIGLGFGGGAQLDVGSHGFALTTAHAAVIPYGAAGGGVSTSTERDYHRGLGATQLLGFELGRRDLGVLRVRGRSYQIGAGFGDGTEWLSYLDAGGVVALAGHHAIGVEAGLMYRRATFPGAPEMAIVSDRGVELRALYMIVNDLAFGSAP